MKGATVRKTRQFGAAAELYEEDVARRFAVMNTHDGKVAIRLHTIWLPEFAEFVTKIVLDREAASLLSTLLAHYMHGYHP